MKRRLITTLLVASFAAASAASAVAQNATPREVAPRPESVGNTMNGSPAGSPSGIRYYQYNRNLHLTGDALRDYENARASCDSLPPLQQPACNDDVNGRFTFEDPMCAKFSGAALDACVHGADHGG